MGKALILGKDTKHLDKDIELCRTTNERISDQAAQLLIENQIPFTRSFIISHRLYTGNYSPVFPLCPRFLNPSESEAQSVQATTEFLQILKNLS